MSFDRWLFAPAEDPGLHRRVQRGLAAVMALRLTLSSYAAFGGQPRSFFKPTGITRLFPGVPSSGALAVLQVGGAVAAWLAAVPASDGRRQRAFTAAWTVLLVLAGFRTSFGKVLHNDVLVLLAAIPFLVRPAGRSGWAPRTSMLVVALAYCIGGLQKLRFGGLAWITGDNLHWVMVHGAASGRAPTTSVATFVASHAWLCHAVAAATIAFEISFPVVLRWARACPAYVAGAAVLHAATWVTLGLDYWGWALTVLVVVGLPSSMGSPRRPLQSQPATATVA